MDEKYVLIVGDLGSGFKFIGPFDSFDDADNEAANYRNEFTWIATLYAPSVNEEE